MFYKYINSLYKFLKTYNPEKSESELKNYVNKNEAILNNIVLYDVSGQTGGGNISKDIRKMSNEAVRLIESVSCKMSGEDQRMLIQILFLLKKVNTFLMGLRNKLHDQFPDERTTSLDTMLRQINEMAKTFAHAKQVSEIV
jgi:hypothetical protein